MSIQVIDEFNTLMKLLVLKVVEKYPDDHEIDRSKQRMFAAINIDDSIALTLLGPSLWKHRKQLIEKDVNHFLTYNFADDMPPAHKLVYSGFVIRILNKIRKDIKTLTDKECNDLYIMIKRMLYLYAEYMKFQK